MQHNNNLEKIGNYHEGLAPEIKETGEMHEVTIGNKFWSLLIQKLGIPSKARIENPRYLKIVFGSQHESFKERRDTIVLSTPEEEGELIIIGHYFPDAEQIHFNTSLEAIGNELAIELIIHELVHYVQDVTGKYPEMGKKKTVGDGRNLPWEKEAYRFMEELKDDFNRYCELL